MTFAKPLPNIRLGVFDERHDCALIHCQLAVVVGGDAFFIAVCLDRTLCEPSFDFLFKCALVCIYRHSLSLRNFYFARDRIVYDDLTVLFQLLYLRRDVGD